MYFKVNVIMTGMDLNAMIIHYKERRILHKLAPVQKSSLSTAITERLEFFTPRLMFGFIAQMEH